MEKETLTNSICFENGVVHDLTSNEIDVIRKAIISVPENEVNADALESLKSLFFEFLD